MFLTEESSNSSKKSGQSYFLIREAFLGESHSRGCYSGLKNSFLGSAVVINRVQNHFFRGIVALTIVRAVSHEIKPTDEKRGMEE